MTRTGSLVLVVLLGSWTAAAEVGVEVELFTLPCIPTAGVWHVPPGSQPQVVVPPLTVVDTDIRPERTRLYLDGRFIGLADDFDGYPDYLYLKPGRYRLEGRLGGYTTAAFDIEAEPGCRSEVRHWLPRVPGTEKEPRGGHPERPVPFKRVYAPASERAADLQPAGRRRPGRADPSLRPDLARRLDRRVPDAGARPESGGLRLDVTPANASVYVDGVFVATAAELAKLVEPLAVEAGQHRLEVMAPGHRPEVKELEVVAGETLSLEVRLVPQL